MLKVNDRVKNAYIEFIVRFRLNLGIKPEIRIKREKPNALFTPTEVYQSWSMNFILFILNVKFLIKGIRQWNHS